MVSVLLLLLLQQVSCETEWTEFGTGDDSGKNVDPDSVAYAYVGCYKERLPGYNDLSGPVMTSFRMSAEICARTCKGFRNFGIQHQAHCICGDNYGNVGPADETLCDNPCSANMTQNCGGQGYNAIYRYLNPSTNTYLGCVKDRTPNENWFASEGMTIGLCLKFCQAYKVYGLTDRMYCFCGNTIDNSGLAASTMLCNQRCLGNKQQICGAPGLMSLYRNPDPKPDSQSYIPVGCYFERAADNALKLKKEVSNDMTIESCQAICQGFTYFAIFKSRVCTCDNAGYDRFGVSPFYNCWFKCGGSAMQMCGSTVANSVYSGR